ncbi:hypothetical protein CRD59_06645 [Bifidobacterium xylocopae]|uniref:Uncharacterized protein n=1 Tax=Bifidobacterium xylocopae TaxID=2493119 RepID=A0A366KB16_9BIFI|nr:hypothetical protein CRD59_06645 [Bifidobacterium xylocopae]
MLQYHHRWLVFWWCLAANCSDKVWTVAQPCVLTVDDEGVLEGFEMVSFHCSLVLLQGQYFAIDA